MTSPARTSSALAIRSSSSNARSRCRAHTPARIAHNAAVVRVVLPSGDEVDLASPEDLERLERRVISALTPPAPLPFRERVAKTTPASPFTYTFLDLGGPTAPGMEIDVLRYSLFPNDVFSTTTTGNVVAFVGSVAPADTNVEPMFSEMVDFQVGIPAVGTWTAHQLTLRWQEHLILCVKAWPASTQLIGSLQGQKFAGARFKVT